MEQILTALRSIYGHLNADGIDRFDLHVRMRQEPGEATIDRETAGFRERRASVSGVEGMPGLEP